MNSGLIATRYATALLRFAEDTKSTEKVYEEMKVLAGTFEITHELNAALDNPVISKDTKKNLILTSAGKNVCPATERFIDLILTKKREAFLQSISLRYIDLYRTRKNIHKAVITTATAIDAQTEKKLIGYIESEIKGKVEFEMKIDEAILGGFMIEVGSNRWDFSLSNQLRRIRQEYIKLNNSIL
ncbi:MAG: F0F1 ATP synthase subunit delta [Paludibacter sp.]|nr:F0F1 ATP synthase subunit delta [Paludibacter sp.]